MVFILNAAHGSASDSVLVILMPVTGKQRLLFVTVVSMTEEEEKMLCMSYVLAAFEQAKSKRIIVAFIGGDTG